MTEPRTQDYQRLAAAARKAQEGCGSLMWLANNLHNADTPLWRELLMSAITDAKAGYAAVDAVLGPEPNRRRCGHR